MYHLTVSKIGDGYGVILPTYLLDAMALKDGSVLEAEYAEGVLRLRSVGPEFAQQVAALMQVEAEHHSSFRELAKR